MTGIIKGLLRQYEGLQDKYISTGRLELERDTYSIIPTGRDEAVREYTDGASLRRMRFKVMGMLGEGCDKDLDNLRFMQGISDYLTGLDEPCEGIISFVEVSPPVIEKAGATSGVYTFTADCIYLKN